MWASEREGKGFVSSRTWGMHFWGGAGGVDGGNGGGLGSGERAEGRPQSEAVLRKVTPHPSACAA